MLLLGFPLGIVVQGIFAGIGAYLSELYPSSIRGSGQGFCYNLGRGLGSFFPILVGSLAQGQRVAADPAALKLMLSLGANKGLHGIAMFMNSPSSVIAKTPIRHLADFKGKKIRVLASPFQMAPIAKLGATRWR